MTDLYTKYADDFSKTRGSAWKGWELSLEFFPKEPLEVLDIGCGNGRFLKFLFERQAELGSYLGVDKSARLLEIASSIRSEGGCPINFQMEDLLGHWEVKKKKFNLITCFGVTHHLETESSRKYLFGKVLSVLAEGGIFVVTFWQFRALKIFQSARILQPNLYELSFNKLGSRICYEYPPEEINHLLSPFKLISTFKADAKNSNGNLYFVLTRD